MFTMRDRGAGKTTSRIEGKVDQEKLFIGFAYEPWNTNKRWKQLTREAMHGLCGQKRIETNKYANNKSNLHYFLYEEIDGDTELSNFQYLL